MRQFVLLVVVSLAIELCSAQKQPVKLTESGSEVLLSNELLTFSFNKKTASLDKILQNGQNLLGNVYGNGYLMGPGFSMRPSVYKLLRQTSGLVEISFTHEASNGYFFELHYVLLSGLSGISWPNRRNRFVAGLPLR